MRKVFEQARVRRRARIALGTATVAAQRTDLRAREAGAGAPRECASERRLSVAASHQRAPSALASLAVAGLSASRTAESITPASLAPSSGPLSLFTPASSSPGLTPA